MQLSDAASPVTTAVDLRIRAQALAGAAADWLDPASPIRRDAVDRTLRAPNSFTARSISEAIRCAMSSVTSDDLLAWMGEPVEGGRRRIVVLNAGNVPFVGLQDFLAVVLSGHRYVGVTSRKSPYLLPAFAESVRRRAPDVDVVFSDFDGALDSAGALIATGSTATAQIVSRRFLEAGVPRARQLLRGTRLGAAQLDGTESERDLYGLARDALLHDGRGCRNVAVVLAPESVGPGAFVVQAERFRSEFPPHASTRRAVRRAARFLHAVGEPFIEGDGFLVVENDVALREPGVVRWLRFGDARAAEAWIERNEGLLQVVIRRSVPAQAAATGKVEYCSFGCGQEPALDWRPDGIDTMSFLREIAAVDL